MECRNCQKLAQTSLSIKIIIRTPRMQAELALLRTAAAE